MENNTVNCFDEIIHLSDAPKHCSDCGAELEVIGRQFVRREFRFTPEQRYTYWLEKEKPVPVPWFAQWLRWPRYMT